MTYYVYIITNKSHTVLYTGVTNNLDRRMYEHKNKLFKGFSNNYNVNKLVWFDTTDSSMSAIEAEKKIKNWRRSWKIDLIEKENPEWRDLSDVGDPESSSG